jgi:pyruvate,water dikinase
VVGCGDATKLIKNGQQITVSCEGKDGNIYKDKVKMASNRAGLQSIHARHHPFILDPDRAFELSNYPIKGLGEWNLVISNSIKIHPLALL